MAIDLYRLKDKSDAELHEWLSDHDTTTTEYLMGIRELMERNDAPGNRRERIVMGIAVIAVAVIIVAVVLMNE